MRRSAELLLLHDGAVATGIAAATAKATYYISPTGDNSFAGTQSKPWLTFAFALPLLTPGDTLVMLNGTYTSATTGFPQITTATGAVNGTAANRITLRALNERQALIDMTGSSGAVYGLRVEKNYWDIRGVRVLGADINVGGPKSNISIYGSSFVRLFRCLSEFPNRYGNVHPIEFELCTSCLAEECEVYSFHRHGILGFTSTDLSYIRCYGADRNRADLGGGYVSNRKPGGDEGFSFYGTSNSLMLNCVLEGNNEGFQIHGYPLNGDHTTQPAGGYAPELGNFGGQNNQILGCIFIGKNTAPPRGNGMKLDSREFPSASSGTLQAGTYTTTAKLKTTSSAVTGFYVGWRFRTTSGAGSGQTFTITAYDGPTKVATLSGTLIPPADGTTGYKVNSDKFWPCQNNTIQHFLVFRADKGIINESGVGNTYSYATIYDMDDQDGVQIWETNGGTGGDMMCPTITCSANFDHILFYQGTDYGFTHRTADAMTSSIRKCNAFGANLGGGFFNYHPNESETDASGNVQDSFEIEPTNLFPAQGDFSPVWVNPTSNMYQKASDGQSIGCEILYRYDDAGVLTSTPLWHPSTGEFPRGALVAGVNDTTGVDAESPFDLHTRLNVSPTSLPENYG